MNKWLHKLIFIMGVICVSTGYCYSADVINQDVKPIYKIGTKIFEPFVIQDRSGALSGISIDIINDLAVRNNFNYRFILYDDLPSLLDSIESGSVDLAISALSITEGREIQMDFSYPYYRTGLAILLSGSSSHFVHTFAGFIKTIFSPTILKSILVLVSVIFIMANIIWWIEHYHNPAFSPNYWQGLWDAIWWSTVTVTTVGYGDKVPRSPLGRVITVIWMFVGIFLISFFTASISSSLTIQKLGGSISGVNDLPGKVVGTIDQSTGALFLSSIHANVKTYSNFNDALSPLISNEIDAFVYDLPRLQYFVQQFPHHNLTVVDQSFDSQFYGIAFPTGSPLREMFNRGILNMEESRDLDLILQKWLE